MAIAILGSALGIRSLLLRTGTEGNPRDHLAAEIAGCVWLAAPWQMGATCWPIMSGVLFSVLFFVWAFAFVKLDTMTWRAIGGFGFCLALSFLTYEAFYFLWFPLLVLYAGFEWRKANKVVFVKLIAAASVSQLLCIGYNRHIKTLNAGASKEINANILDLVAANLNALPRVILESVAEVQAAFMICLYILLGLYLLALGLSVRAKGFNATARALASVCAFVIGAVAVSVLLYSTVGYLVTSVGMQSRTMLPFTVIIAVGIGALLVSIPRTLWLVRSAIALILFSTIALLSIANEKRLVDWKEAWAQQQLVLSKVPLFRFKDFTSTDAVLFIGPAYVNSVIVFGAQWDITGAINNLPELRKGRKAYQNLIRFFPATNIYDWEFKSGILYQRAGTVWTLEYPVSRLFVWDFTKKQFYEAPDGFSLKPK